VVFVAKGLYHYVKKVWRNPRENLGNTYKDRLIAWRREPRFKKVDKPSRLDKARALGYKAKKGIIVVRGRTRRGGRTRPLFGRRGRKPAKSGLTGFTPTKSRQLIVEERISKKYPNLEVLGSYKVGEDGRHSWFEVILADPSRPEIKKDKNLKWISNKKQRKRVVRGLTPSGKRARGLK
jgi:large subunit ribosomal protein L15e